MDSNQKQSDCIGGRHYSNTNNLVEYENVNPKTNKNVIVKKGKYDNCGRAKSQIFTK